MKKLRAGEVSMDNGPSITRSRPLTNETTGRTGLVVKTTSRDIDTAFATYVYFSYALFEGSLSTLPAVSWAPKYRYRCSVLLHCFGSAPEGTNIVYTEINGVGHSPPMPTKINTCFHTAHIGSR